jgi:hypothetical protein
MLIKKFLAFFLIIIMKMSEIYGVFCPDGVEAQLGKKLKYAIL